MSERSIGVDVAGRPYEVLVGHGLIDRAGERLRRRLRRPFAPIVLDATVARLHGARLEASLRGAKIACPTIVLEPGEQAKSFEGLAGLCEALLALGVERTDLILAFGGGVVGDLAGFAAAILKRGVAFVQIPTTLLAQVDSSVGGKTAIDTARGKNLIGAFHQPSLVLADLDVLDTLPQREMRCGFAEVLKYGLLGDEPFFAWLEANGAQVLSRAPGPLAHAVGVCVATKARIVAQDERESGPRALLNLGHTFGHAIEAAAGFGGAVEHGEAVALGCAQAFRFSAALGLCDPDQAARVQSAIGAAGLPTRLAELFPRPPGAQALIDAMAQDKKAQQGRLSFVLVRAIGEAFVAHDVDSGALRDFLIREGAAP